MMPSGGVKHAALFLKVNAVTAGCRTLDFADDAVIPDPQTEMTGVDKRQHAVCRPLRCRKNNHPGHIHHRVPAQPAHAASAACRTGGMSPVHRPLMFTCRMVLKECVIATAEINKPVRIIHPSGRWSQMKNRVPVSPDGRGGVSSATCAEARRCFKANLRLCCSGFC